MTVRRATVSGLLRDVRDVGRDVARGGYSRFSLGSADREMREWFCAEAERRSLEVEVDRNGAIWAWRWGVHGTREHGIVTGSHLDSVPGGGQFDGPLGLASALVAVDLLDDRGVLGERPLAIVVFPEEEGARFGQACLGSQLMTGALDPSQVLGIRDVDGTSLAEALAGVGVDPDRVGRDDDAIGRIDAFVELHVEQGRGLVDLGQPVAIASSIIGHGLWRMTLVGEGNHAGATRMTDRRDPMVAAAATVVAIRDVALSVPEARATVGRIALTPGGTNVIASRVDLWIDVRHPDDSVAAAVVEQIRERASEVAASERCRVELVEESYGGAVHFDEALRGRLESALPDAPVLPTGAGHDAGVLAAAVPTAMLFTRNPTGVSHSPEEQIEDVDAEAGARALAVVLQDLLLTGPRPVGGA